MYSKWQVIIEFLYLKITKSGTQDSHDFILNRNYIEEGVARGDENEDKSGRCSFIHSG